MLLLRYDRTFGHNIINDGSLSCTSDTQGGDKGKDGEERKGEGVGVMGLLEKVEGG